MLAQLFSSFLYYHFSIVVIYLFPTATTVTTKALLAIVIVAIGDGVNG